jgi:hypothetical protein
LAENKKSHLLRGLLLIFIALILIFPFRFFFQRYIAGQDSDGDAIQNTANQSGRSSSNASGSQSQGSIDTPFSGAFYDEDFSMPVTFKGAVLNQEDRSPIKGAHVRMLALSSSEKLEKTTGADGTFAINAPPAYRYELKVDADGYSSYSNNSFVITRPEYKLEILLTPSLLLRGQVVDLQSQGIPGARVDLFMESTNRPSLPKGMNRSPFMEGMNRPSLSTTTDFQGKFVFKSISKDAHLQLDASHPGYESNGKVSATTPADEEITIRMKQSALTGSLFGTVIDTAGKPVAGAVISASGAMISTPDLANPVKSFEITTGQNGEYRFSKIREGFYAVRCLLPGYTPAESQIGTATIVPGKESRLDFTLRAGQQILGIVVNQKGEPVPAAIVQYRWIGLPGRRNSRNRGNFPQLSDNRDGIMVSEQTDSATTDDKGMFQIPAAAEASCQVSIQHRDYLEFSAFLQPSNQIQTLTLDSALFIRGAVRNLQGLPIERFNLVFQSTTKTFFQSYSFTTSDGYFEVRGLPRDKYILSLNVPDQNNSNYSGSIELQTSLQAFLMTGEKSDPAGDFRGQRGGEFPGGFGGRRGGPMARPVNPGRSAQSYDTLSIVTKSASSR